MNPLDNRQFIQRRDVMGLRRVDGFVKSKNYWRCQKDCTHNHCNRVKFRRLFNSEWTPYLGFVDLTKELSAARVRAIKRHKLTVSWFDYRAHKLITVNHEGLIIARS